MTHYWAMSTAAKKKALGRNKEEVRKRLVKRVWKGKTFWIHEKIASRFDRATRQIDAYERKHKVNYRLVGVGSWNWRNIRGRLTLSNHAFGIAFDVNPAKNPMKYGKLVTDQPHYFRQAFHDQGFRWGGRYRVRKDAMHWEA